MPVEPSTVGRMQELPDELLALILDVCSIESLRALRLASKHLNRIATPLAFTHHHLGLHTSSFDRLLTLSRTSLAKHVQKLTLHSDILPDWSREAWEQHIDQLPPFLEWLHETGSRWKDDGYNAHKRYDMLPKHHLTQSELANGFRAYQMAKQEQLACKMHIHALVLKECSSSLPNLGQVVVGKAKPFSGLTNNTPYWKPLTEKILVSPESWFYGRRNNVKPEMEGLGALLLLEAVGYRASFSGVKPVQSMKLDMTFYRSFRRTMEITQGDATSDALSLNSRFEDVKDALRPVRNLEVLAPFAADDWSRDDGGQAAEIHALLLVARELRELDLSYGDAEKKTYVDYHRQFGLLPLFSSEEIVWPHITSLCLTASVPGQAFANFLALHADTLKRLDLRDDVSDDWRVVLESIPKNLHLNSIYLECLWQFWPSKDDPTDGQYVCHFAEGTDEDNEENRALKMFLLHGEGDWKFPVPGGDSGEISEDSVSGDDVGDTTDEYDVAAW